MDYSRREVEQVIDEYIHHARNRDILKDRLLDGMIYDDLAYKYDLSIRQLKNIVYRDSKVVFAHLQ